MRATSHPTLVVMPLDYGPPAAYAPAELEDEDAWGFEDAELARQRRAIHRGRTWILAALAGSLAVLTLGIAWVC